MLTPPVTIGNATWDNSYAQVVWVAHVGMCLNDTGSFWSRVAHVGFVTVVTSSKVLNFEER